MNKDKIDLIATKIMGWTIGGEKCDGQHRHYIKDGYRVAWRYTTGLWCDSSMRDFDPYESGADCFMIIDRMSKLGWFIKTDVECFEDNTLSVFFVKPSSEGIHHIIHQKEKVLVFIGGSFNHDLKTAICDAAIKAVE